MQVEQKCEIKSDELDDATLNQRIDSIIKKEGYISCDVMNKNFNTDGGNYLGKLYKIKIKGKTADGQKETPIFVKALPPDAIDMELISLKNVYKKELFAYKELSKVFYELQDEAQIPTDMRFKRAKIYDESFSKMIILEDISENGFNTSNRMDCVTLEMAEASIKQLAKFHALSFVLQDKRPEYFEHNIKTLDQPFLFGTKEWDEFCRQFTKTTLEYLDEDMRRSVEDKIPGFILKYSEYYQDEASKRCVCHGDYRPNNIMFKEKDGKIVDAIVVDYQLIYYGCPILDFYYLIYIGTDLEFRRAHIFHLKDLYYETLRNFLQYFEVSVETMYPRQTFEKDFVEKRDYGLIISVLYLQFIFVSEGNIPDLTKETVLGLEIVLDERFRGRIVGVFQEFIELGLL